VSGLRAAAAGGTLALRLRVAVSRPSLLALVLLDAKGRRLESWRVAVRVGTTALSFELPPNARAVGRASLRISGSGGLEPRALALVLDG
jgi:hypothetical protein